MSRRRRSSVEQIYTKVRLWCPDDHVVGYAVRQRWATYFVEPDGHTARYIDPAEKLSIPCPDCRKNRTRADLQVSAAKLKNLLDTPGTVDHRIS